ncbi:DHH family phosphoesterase [Megasphaera vaginalis (ex Bordigoni et al. 2020)]|uniref:DHH family phosphoesterase n=1 Tax=Megasphaera vaginalis (ex Bordigoni et al. 2020) TaxID=2045301 RepID=UPI000C7C8E24|nr:DHH family phosphoesterase [Megasphaera vaginalis (ex Bordigoni et al. 2020)]
MFKKLLGSPFERYYLLVISLLLMIIAVYNWVVAALAVILIIGAFFLSRKDSNERNREISRFFDAISRSVDQATTYAVQNLPIGIAIIDSESALCWSNSVFMDWLAAVDDGQKMSQIMPNLNLDKVWGKSGYFFETINDRYYRVVYKYLQTDASEDDNYLILYFEDITDTERQKENALQTMPVFAEIVIDNMEEVGKGMSAVQQATLWTDVNNCIVGEMTALGCYIHVYGNENYFVCLTRKAFEGLKKNHFAILDKIRAIHTVNRIPVTVSMGVAAVPEETFTRGLSDFNELADKAHAGVDLALGRGGDQVVVYEESGEVHFFGGKTQSLEKNTRVRARIVAQALHELIDTSENVLVMGHEREDYDCIGSAIGVAHMARIAGKSVHIVASKETDAIQPLLDKVSEVELFRNLLITPETAEMMCTEKTLLFITDTHRADMTAAPKLLEKTKRRVVIDHHRRSSDFIKKPLLTYTETSSSSTSELVTELIQYFRDDVELEKVEATALYAGIVVDTKSFAVQTGVRTFDAAAYLRRSGADPTIVRSLFSSDFALVKTKAQMLADAVIMDSIAMTNCPPGVENAPVVSAQVADMLLGINTVEASFAFYALSDGNLGVSARSQGNINVQLVMEELGGGGHRTVAGAQLKGLSPAEGQAAVRKALQQVAEKESTTI